MIALGLLSGLFLLVLLLALDARAAGGHVVGSTYRPLLVGVLAACAAVVIGALLPDVVYAGWPRWTAALAPICAVAMLITAFARFPGAAGSDRRGADRWRAGESARRR